MGMQVRGTHLRLAEGGLLVDLALVVLVRADVILRLEALLRAEVARRAVTGGGGTQSGYRGWGAISRCETQLFQGWESVKWCVE